MARRWISPPSPVQVHKTVRRKSLQPDHRSLAIRRSPLNLRGTRLHQTVESPILQCDRDAHGDRPITIGRRTVHPTYFIRMVLPEAPILSAWVGSTTICNSRPDPQKVKVRLEAFQRDTGPLHIQFVAAHLGRERFTCRHPPPSVNLNRSPSTLPRL